MNTLGTMDRDQPWLEARLVHVWQRGFVDLVPGNRVEICFGRTARTRLGSIRMSRDKSVSKILINRLFQDERVPVEVVDATIAHELVHYAHGFSSPFEQKFCSPHAGGVVSKELKVRGFAETLAFQKRWLKIHWLPLLRTEGLMVRRVRPFRPSHSGPWRLFRLFS